MKHKKKQGEDSSREPRDSEFQGKKVPRKLELPASFFYLPEKKVKRKSIPTRFASLFYFKQKINYKIVSRSVVAYFFFNVGHGQNVQT
jgi:hypothetical protein